jgi:hypothetical protein
VSDTPAFTSTREALGVLRVAMGYLFAADHAAMAAETQAQCLLELEQLDAVKTAARAKVLGAFTTGRGYSADANYPGALDDLVRLCVQLDGIEHGTAPTDGEDTHTQPEDSPSRETLRQAIIGKTTILLLHSRSSLDVR